MKHKIDWGYVALAIMIGPFLCWDFWSAVVDTYGRFTPRAGDWISFAFLWVFLFGGVYLFRKIRRRK
ncbi:MAG: hypothetical protein EOP21_00665 [Hyphomicrobiales bacterium]|nr:MAG: hypothetical protein EOP21_00665 [Hyphomicrobiales bacterium]